MTLSKALCASSAAAAESLVVANGTRISLRQLGADDRAGMAALFARLTPESRYQRFLSPKLELTPRELTFFTDSDHLNHEAIAAVDEHDNSIVGVARYVRDAGRADVAERDRGRRCVPKDGHRHRPHQPHDPPRARQRPEVPPRDDAVGEPRRARAAAKPRISCAPEPRRRNRARTQAQRVQPPRSGARARKPAFGCAGSSVPSPSSTGGTTNSRLTASDSPTANASNHITSIERTTHVPVPVSPTDAREACPAAPACGRAH